MSASAGFAPFAARMQAEGLPDIVIRTFAHYYEQLAAGAKGLIPESEIRPVEALPDAEALPADLAEVGQAELPHTVLLKLNGGLGTSMGLAKAKSLLEVKEGMTFLDIIARQAIDGGIPLVLMDSYNTRDDSLAKLEGYPDLKSDIPLDFLQHKVPKITQQGLGPAMWEADPDLAWCPPGHGDIYTALVTSGMLATLLDRGYKYAFVSNADNLGAVVDSTILGYFARENLPFMMEVADRTEADKKGGHLAQTPEGQLILRESAQCPPEDEATFQDIGRHRFFNTNNLWINLPALQQTLADRKGILGLPMICNAKTVDPRNKTKHPGLPAGNGHGLGHRGVSGGGGHPHRPVSLRPHQEDQRPAGRALGQLHLDPRFPGGGQSRAPPTPGLHRPGSRVLSVRGRLRGPVPPRRAQPAGM